MQHLSHGIRVVRIVRESTSWRRDDTGIRIAEAPFAPRLRIAIYLSDATLAGAFVARWCAGYKVESADGAFQIRKDAPMPRLLLGLHKTP